MPHINEGTLHAYLDGALPLPGVMSVAEIEQHVAACEHCHTALNDERTLRDRAGAVLGGADLQIDRPSFAAIQSQTDRHRARRIVRLRRLQGLAAAAVVVTVVGVSLVFRDGGDVISPARTEMAFQPQEAPAAGAADEQTGRPTEPLSDADVSRPMAAPASTVTARGNVASGDSDSAASTAETQVMADRLDVGVATGGVAAPSAPLLEEASARETAGRRSEISAMVAVPVTDPPVEALWRDLAQSVAPTMSTESKAGAAAEGVVAAVDAAPPWLPATPDAAARHLGRPVPIVPDLTVIGYEVGAIGSYAAVRIGQRMADGTSISLIAWNAPAMEGLAQAVMERASEAGLMVVYGDGLGIMASGELPADQLEQLASLALDGGG